MTVDELQVLITANTSELQKEIQRTQQSIANLQKTTAKSTSAISGAFKFLKTSIIALGIGKVIQSIFSNMDDAISRLDTLNNYTNVMSNLGIATEDADASMKRLSDKLLGLPTTLDSAVGSVQRFTSANGNVKASTDMFLALNNAILSGGANTQIQASALEQLSQAYAKGKPDMMEWRSAMSAMPAQLKQVAMAMGYVSADALGEELRSGKVSMNEFMKTIVKLNKEEVNGFQSFEEQAKTSSNGVKTSMINVKTALTRGLTEIMNAIGQSNIAGFFNNIKEAINKVIPYITGFVKACVWAINIISSLFGKKTNSNINSTSSSLNNASSSMGGLGSSATDTAKDMDKATGSAKKLNKQLNGLASFDEMNVLTENTGDSGSGSSGSSAGGGVDLGDWDFGDWDTSLDNVSSKADEIAEKIKSAFRTVGDVLKTIWNSEPVQAYANLVGTKLDFVKNLAITLGTDLWTNLGITWSNIEENVSLTCTNISTLMTTMWTDIATGIEKWGQPIIDRVSGVFNSIWKDAIDPAVTTMTKIWAEFSGILVEKWNQYGKPLVDNIGEFVTKTIDLFQSIWDNVLEPIITPFLETLSWLWDKHLKGMIENIIDFVGKLTNGALEIYNKFIQPILKFLMEYFKPAWSYTCNAVIGVIGTVVGFISDTVSNIFRYLGGLIDFITGVFTGNWSKAWDGIKTMFECPFKAMENIAKAVINLIIDIINSVISGINAVNFNIPDWVPVLGGTHVGFNIPKIPKLARGTIVDKPTVAMIGEAGKEAVMPLEHNTGWIDKLATDLADKVGKNGDTPIQLTVKIGEDTILDKVIQGMKDKIFETNGEVFAI